MRCAPPQMGTAHYFTASGCWTRCPPPPSPSRRRRWRYNPTPAGSCTADERGKAAIGGLPGRVLRCKARWQNAFVMLVEGAAARMNGDQAHTATQGRTACHAGARISKNVWHLCRVHAEQEGER